MENLLTVQDVARKLNVSTAFVTQLARENKLKAYKLESVWRFDIKDIEEYVSSRDNTTPKKSE